MKVFLIGLILFILPFILQILLWRIRLIKRSGQNVNRVFILFWLFFFVSYVVMNYIIGVGLFIFSQNFLGLLHSFLFALSIFIAYIITYTAIELDSPSGAILLKTEKGNICGLKKERLYETLNDKDVILKRLQDLYKSNKLVKNNDHYSITKSGKRFLQLFLLPRRLFTTTDPKG